MAATGRQLKQSVNVFHNLMLYRRLPEKSRTIIETKYYCYLSYKRGYFLGLRNLRTSSYNNFEKFL